MNRSGIQFMHISVLHNYDNKALISSINNTKCPLTAHFRTLIQNPYKKYAAKLLPRTVWNSTYFVGDINFISVVLFDQIL
ncbi:hypothetical protein GCM10022289_16410 [Pedobacter jeongneungensis]|uniref:Uncharacterized protein n=1 Tax=Pedobacter jeongneungensis TaxID=947309 RepID=A0ABP8BAD1_9SPHI